MNVMSVAGFFVANASIRSQTVRAASVSKSMIPKTRLFAEVGSG